MLTYILMGLLVLCIAITTLWGVKYDPDKNSFMSIEDTTFLRGFWCIIVVLVHIPKAYQNPIQDMLGSFAYIGVTFFFMTSAYGLKWSINHKPGYMEHFWRRRLPLIFIPALIANAFDVILKGVCGEEITLFSFFNINDWVKVLLLYYLVFWIIYGIAPRIIAAGDWQDAVMCSIVVLFSLIEYFTSLKITSIWIVEPLGFAYGILAAKYSEKIREWFSNNWLSKVLSLMIAAGVLGVAYLKFKPVFFLGDYLLKIVLGIAITSFMYAVVSKLKVGNKVNTFLGNISYEVYLLHGSIFGIVIMMNSGINSGMFIILSLVLTIVFAEGLKVVSGKILRVFR